MINVQRKLVFAAIVACLTTVSSVSYAAPGGSKGTGGWEPSADHLESAVISLHTDPLVDPEPACVALQIGMNLLMDTINVDGNHIPVTPADEVTLFATTGGVQLINPKNDLAEIDCEVPVSEELPEGKAPLDQLLKDFVSLGGEVVVCPLCARTRKISEPTYGNMGSGPEIHDLFLYGDKVINF